MSLVLTAVVRAKQISVQLGSILFSCLHESLMKERFICLTLFE